MMIQQYHDPFVSFQNMFREDPVAQVAFLNLIYFLFVMMSAQGPLSQILMLVNWYFIVDDYQ